MLNMTVVEESKLPKYTDPLMEDWATELYLEFLAYQRPRLMLETEIWPNCDKAWQCIRDDMPYLPTMRLIDNGMLGTADIRVALKGMRNQLLQGLVPTDESFLEFASLDQEDNEEQLMKCKDFMMDFTDKCKLRKHVSAFIDQWSVRGTSAMGVLWEQRYQVQRSPRNMVKDLKSLAADGLILGPDGQSMDPSSKIPVRYYKQTYNGPRVFAIDMYRLLFDPKADLGLDEDVGFIYQFFKTKADLLNAKDPDTGKALYDAKVLDDVEEWKYADYYHSNPFACEGTRLMGIDPNLEDMGKFVPVYLYHRQFREFESGEVYVDKFFYCARSKNDRAWKIIRVQDNPNDNGKSPFFVATCDQWLGVPYGTGLAEKSLTAWRSKNILEAVGLNMQVLQAAPPMFYVGGVIKNDGKPKVMPGVHQEIVNRPNVGLDWIKPYPVNPNNVEIQMQATRYYGENILSQTGVNTATTMTDPTKSVSKGKTATEIRQETTEGTLAQQTYIDQLGSEVVEPVCQLIYDLARQYYTEDETKFVTVQNGKPVSSSITRDELNRDRQVKIVGRRGLANKAHMLDNLNEILKILSMPQAIQALGPGAKLMGQDVLIKLVASLGLQIKPEYTATPEQLLSSDPQIQQTAISAALQNPEMRQAIAQHLLQSPEGQAFIQQIQQEAKEQILQEVQAAPVGEAQPKQLPGAA